jgi:hypothetical protein
MATLATGLPATVLTGLDLHQLDLIKEFHCLINRSSLSTLFPARSITSSGQPGPVNASIDCLLRVTSYRAPPGSLSLIPPSGTLPYGSLALAGSPRGKVEADGFSRGDVGTAGSRVIFARSRARNEICFL